MSDMIHVTIEYSNAVLVALLPIFSDFARKLDLPVPNPIATNHVQRFLTGGLVIEGYPIDVKAHLVLTNGYEFWHSWGHVDDFRSPRDYFTCQHVELVPEFFGTLRLDRSEAVDSARRAFSRREEVSTTRRVSYAGTLEHQPPPKAALQNRLVRLRT